MSFTYYEHTNMYLCDATETIIEYPARISIQMIIGYFPTAADTITFTDAVADSDFDSADDVICTLVAAVNYDTIIVNWSAKPRHFYGLKVSAITDAQVQGFVYLA